MDRYKKLVTITSLLVMVLGLTMVASAQWRDRRGNNDDYYGRNNNNLDSAIRTLKQSSRTFERTLDRELDRSRYDGSRREDNLNNLANDFRKAAEKLDDEYDGRRDMRKSSDEARRVLNYGSQLDRALSRSRLTRNSYALQGQWNGIEQNLRTISRAFNISYNGQYGRNRGRYERDDDRWGRDDDRRGRNNGRYGNLRSTIVNLRNKTQRFENRVDREYDDDDRYNRRRGNGNLENLVNRFNNAVKDLEDEYDDRRDYNDSYNEVRNVLSLGEQVDRELSYNRVNRNLRNDWNSIEQDLRTLANAFNLSYNGRSNRNTRISDIWRNFPFE